MPRRSPKARGSKGRCHVSKIDDVSMFDKAECLQFIFAGGNLVLIFHECCSFLDLKINTLSTHKGILHKLFSFNAGFEIAFLLSFLFLLSTLGN